jgi:hypothetical protein
VWIGLQMTRDGAPNGRFVLGFFGLCCLAAVAQMLPWSSRLRLSPEGFSIRHMYRERFFRWSEVSSFEVAKVGQNPMVVFDFTDAYTGARAMRRLSRAMAGAEGALPDTYGRKADDLARLMNDWRARAAR